MYLVKGYSGLLRGHGILAGGSTSPCMIPYTCSLRYLTKHILTVGAVTVALPYDVLYILPDYPFCTYWLISPYACICFEYMRNRLLLPTVYLEILQQIQRLRPQCTDGRCELQPTTQLDWSSGIVFLMYLNVFRIGLHFIPSYI